MQGDCIGEPCAEEGSREDVSTYCNGDGGVYTLSADVDCDLDPQPTDISSTEYGECEYPAPSECTLQQYASVLQIQCNGNQVELDPTTEGCSSRLGSEVAGDPVGEPDVSGCVDSDESDPCNLGAVTTTQDICTAAGGTAESSGQTPCDDVVESEDLDSRVVGECEPSTETECSYAGAQTRQVDRCYSPTGDLARGWYDDGTSDCSLNGTVNDPDGELCRGDTGACFNQRCCELSASNPTDASEDMYLVGTFDNATRPGSFSLTAAYNNEQALPVYKSGSNAVVGVFRFPSIRFTIGTVVARAEICLTPYKNTNSSAVRVALAPIECGESGYWGELVSHGPGFVDCDVKLSPLAVYTFNAGSDARVCEDIDLDEYPLENLLGTEANGLGVYVGVDSAIRLGDHDHLPTAPQLVLHTYNIRACGIR